MDFSALLKAVNEFWDWVWPPVICLTALLVIVRLVARQTFLMLRGRILVLLTQDSRLDAKALKRFGLDKLAPIIVAFFILFLLDTARGVVITVGQVVPPNVTYQYDLWLERHSSDRDFPCLWAHMGDLSSFDSFQRSMERVLSEEEAQHSSSPLIAAIHQWDDNGGRAYVAFSACKFFLLWALIWSGVEMTRTGTIWTPLSRLLISSLIICAVGTFYFFRHIWAIEQAEFSRINAVETVLFEKPPVCDEAFSRLETHRKPIEDASRQLQGEKDVRWWSVKAVDSYYLKWVWNQLLKKT